ncbi:MAG: AlpA family phage regulatory protein [Verrucomicrobiaceae bacterium]|nr:MAG: AlpA family phage regulatory protein [Verrucomicrobiaceae bacterium]
MPTSPSEMDGYLRLSQVLKLIPVSRSTWYRGVKDGRYPRQVRISTRLSGWRISDVHRFLEAAAEVISDTTRCSRE